MNTELSLYDYWRIVNRRKWSALLVFLATVLSTMFYTRLQPNVYQSQAVLKLQPPASLSKIPGSDASSWDPWGSINTELRVITSAEVAERAAVKLGLTDPASGDRGRGFSSLLASYSAERLQESSLVSVSARGPDPVKTSDIVNAVIAAYKDFDVEQRSIQGRKTVEDIAARKAEVEQQLRSLERQKQNFVERNPKTGLGAALANQLADLEIRRRDLMQRYTPNHPEVAAMDQRVQVVQSKLSEIPAQEVELARISRELRMQEELYTTLNREYEQAKLGLASTVSYVSVVTPAYPSEKPVAPNKRMNFVIGCLLGLFLAVTMVFLLENLDVSISTIEDIEGFLKLPVLGIIPSIMSEKHIDNWLTHVFKKERYTVDAFRSVLIFNRKYASSVIESYHTLRTNIMSQLGTKESVSIVISSSGAAEGKTLTAVNFALAAAHSGLKTLLIDADMRRPAIYQIFGLERQPGLSDVLAGKADWRSAVCESADFLVSGYNFESLMRFQGIENFHVLNSGTTPSNVIDLIDSAEWDRIMGELKDNFDLIIFDAPPVLLFVDSVILSKHTDGVVMVYKAGKIARGALKRAKEQITGVNARMIGVVLNGVRAGEMGPQYGYYYYDYSRYSRR